MEITYITSSAPMSLAALLRAAAKSRKDGTEARDLSEHRNDARAMAHWLATNLDDSSTVLVASPSNDVLRLMQTITHPARAIVAIEADDHEGMAIEPPPTACKLSLRASDHAHDLTTTLDAYNAVERLTSPARQSDSEALELTRSELGALLRVLNDDLARQVHALTDTTHALQAAVVRGEGTR